MEKKGFRWVEGEGFWDSEGKDLLLGLVEERWER